MTSQFIKAAVQGVAVALSDSETSPSSRSVVACGI